MFAVYCSGDDTAAGFCCKTAVFQLLLGLQQILLHFLRLTHEIGLLIHIRAAKAAPVRGFLCHNWIPPI